MASSACHCRKPNSSADPRTLLPRQDGHVPLRRRLLRRIHAGGSPGQRRPVDAAGRPQRGPRWRIHLESLGARGWPVRVRLDGPHRSEEHTSELQSPCNLVCRLLLEKKKNSTTCERKNLSNVSTPPRQPR